jgi:Cu(I)/Ag(I) efflux system membrane fusion protein
MNYPRRTFLRLAVACSGALILNGCGKKLATDELPPGVDYFTCAMHPSVNLKAPGKCPICGMQLIPVMKKAAGAVAAGMAGPTIFTVPADRQQQIGVTYVAVERKAMRRSMRAVGTIEFDRKRYWEFVARTDGYVKKLFVTSPGEIVAGKQPLLSFYSPDLFTAEREYVMLLGMRDGAKAGQERDTPESLLESARGRLKEWNVSDEEIADLEKSRMPEQEVTLYSPFRGVVKEVMAEQGGTVKAGDRLVGVADLSKVWVWADFYEAELGALKEGQKATLTVNSYPGEVFEGTVSLIDPFLDEGQRTFKVRIDIENADLKLRPGMYGDVTLDTQGGSGLVIPLNAVMPTGMRNLVFVDRGEGRLEPRAITLGAEYDGYYEVKDGLAEGERIVASATFLIDAEAQIQGALKGMDSATPVPTEAVR